MYQNINLHKITNFLKKNGAKNQKQKKIMYSQLNHIMKLTLLGDSEYNSVDTMLDHAQNNVVSVLIIIERCAVCIIFMVKNFNFFSSFI